MGMMDGYQRVIRLKDILGVKILECGFIRDENFDLVTAWTEWCREYQDYRPVYWAKVKVAPELSNQLSSYLDEMVRYEFIEVDPGDESSWSIVNLCIDNFFQARESILSLGNAVEVLEPKALRFSVIDFAEQIAKLYQVKSKH